MVSSIKDPDALAEGVCRVNIISLDTKDDIIKDTYFGYVKAKIRSLLQSIEEKVKGQPSCFHRFLTVLRSIPDLSQLASVLQGSYGEFVLDIMDVLYSFSIITDRRLTGKHPAVTSQLQDASLHACASASMMSSLETRSDQCDDDQSVVPSHSHANEQGLSYLIYFVGYDIISGHSFQLEVTFTHACECKLVHKGHSHRGKAKVMQWYCSQNQQPQVKCHEVLLVDKLITRNLCCRHSNTSRCSIVLLKTK